MVYPSFNRFRCLFVLIGALCSILKAAAAPATDGQKDGIFQSLEGINSIPMGEPAGSRGTLGLSLGAGASLHSIGDLDPQESRELGFDGGVGRKLVMPRLWLSKGLPIPVDVGLSVGASQTPILQQGAGYLQWTVFEGLGLPALAMRLTHSRLFMGRSTNLATNQASLAGSWTFLRYVTVFGTTSLLQHAGETELPTYGANERLSLAGGSIDAVAAMGPTSTASWMERTSSVGLRLTVIPPFVSVTAEVIRRGDALQSAMAKMAIGL